MGQDTLTNIEGDLWSKADIADLRTDGLEGLISKDFGDNVCEIKAESECTGYCDHQVLINHLGAIMSTRLDSISSNWSFNCSVVFSDIIPSTNETTITMQSSSSTATILNIW